MASEDIATAVYREFNPEPPSLDRLERVYVDLDEARGGESVTEPLVAEIALRREGYLCELLAGHRGCGKTTELLRFSARVQKSANRRVELHRRKLGPLVLIVDDVDKVSMRMHDSGVPVGESTCSSTASRR